MAKMPGKDPEPRKPGRRRKLSHETEAAMVDDYICHRGTVAEIAARYSVSHQTVYDAHKRSLNKEAS